MIMKIPICFLFCLLFAGYCKAQTRPDAHPWNALIKVVDDLGQPVAGAKTWVSYSLPVLDEDAKDWGIIKGLTDTNGIFAVSHTDQSVSIGFHAEKEGYYPTATSYYLGFSADDTNVNWNPTSTLVLVKMNEPIAMYAKKVETKFPKEDGPVGFDLTAGDWVAPYGVGTIGDLFFTVHRKIINAEEYDADVVLTFTNAGDGIVTVPVSANAATTMLRVAAENDYQPNRKWNYHNFTQSPDAPLGYFIRVRTTLDENGNVKSAFYGKIKGDIRFYAGTKTPRAGLGFDYYLNPISNSRNMEFNPGKNLLHNLGPGEDLKEP
jgi:hypothetical protein